MTSTSIDSADTEMLRRGATAPTAADVTIATKTEWLQSHRALKSLARQSAARHYRALFDPRLASLSTTVKPSQNCGWRTFDWHASWEALEETIEPSSASYRSSSPTPLAGGLSSSLPTKSTTGLTWTECLKGTSRGLTCAQAIHGTSVSASRNLENLSESLLDASPSSAPSSCTSPTMMSFLLLSQAPLVRIWCENWTKIVCRP